MNRAPARDPYLQYPAQPQQQQQQQQHYAAASWSSAAPPAAAQSPPSPSSSGMIDNHHPANPHHYHQFHNQPLNDPSHAAQPFHNTLPHHHRPVQHPTPPPLAAHHHQQRQQHAGGGHGSSSITPPFPPSPSSTSARPLPPPPPPPPAAFNPRLLVLQTLRTVLVPQVLEIYQELQHLANLPHTAEELPSAQAIVELADGVKQLHRLVECARAWSETEVVHHHHHHHATPMPHTVGSHHHHHHYQHHYPQADQHQSYIITTPAATTQTATHPHRYGDSVVSGAQAPPAPNLNERESPSLAPLTMRRHPCVRVYGFCKYGKRCLFSQNSFDVCLQNLKGKCQRGDACHERHGE